MNEIVVFLTNHWVLSALLLVLILAFILNESLQGVLGLPQMKPFEAVQLINHQDAQVIDLRNKAAFDVGHIVGALNLPFAGFQDQVNRLESLNKPLILLDANRSDAPKAGKILKSKGKSVILLSGGIEAWKEAGLPLVKK